MPAAYTTSSGGSLPGYTYDWNASYGGKPEVPSPAGSASLATAANVGNLGQLYNLAGSLNQFNQGQLLGQYESAVPGYGGLVKKASGNIGEQLAGNVPSDVVNEIIQTAAERGIMTGSPGSPNANAALLRSMGLTSLGLQQQGQENLISMERAAPIAQPFDVSKLFITPEEIQQAQMAANLYAAAPDPMMAAGAAINAARGPTSGWKPTTVMGPTSSGLPAPGIPVGQPGGLSHISYNPNAFMPGVDLTQGGYGPAYLDQGAVGASPEMIGQEVPTFLGEGSLYE